MLKTLCNPFEIFSYREVLLEALSRQGARVGSKSAGGRPASQSCHLVAMTKLLELVVQVAHGNLFLSIFGFNVKTA